MAPNNNKLYKLPLLLPVPPLSLSPCEARESKPFFLACRRRRSVNSGLQITLFPSGPGLCLGQSIIVIWVNPKRKIFQPNSFSWSNPKKGVSDSMRNFFRAKEKTLLLSKLIKAGESPASSSNASAAAYASFTFWGSLTQKLDPFSSFPSNQGFDPRLPSSFIY